MAALYGVAFGVVAGWNFGAQYFAGYVVEKSLSVDNLFVFVIIMSTFAVPAEHQQRALTFGILLALVMRALFIALGAALLSLFSFMFLIFGLLLIATAVQLFRHRDEDPRWRTTCWSRSPVAGCRSPTATTKAVSSLGGTDAACSRRCHWCW